jgi:hypothetical protein
MANTLKFGNGQWATKEGSTLAYNDENGNFKPLPFDFTRASSATRVGRNGLIETVGSNVPRIDFKDDSNGALKLEPQRSNLITYSEDFSGVGGWGGIGVSGTANYGIAPDGTNTSSQIVFSGASQILRKTVGGLIGNTGVFSLWIKGTAGETISITYGGNADKLVTLGNGWNRFTTDGNVGTLDEIFINTFLSATARTLEVWGGQCELGSYATSYIPTQGSQVTRVADACSQTPPSGIIGQTEGTLFVEIELASASEQIFIITSNAGNEVNRLQIYVDSSRKIGLYRGDASVSILSSSSYSLNSVLKIAAVYKSNDYALYINGVSVGTDTSATIPPTPSLLYLGSYVDGSKNNSVIVKQAQLYNTRLSNAELQALTTL